MSFILDSLVEEVGGGGGGGWGGGEGDGRVNRNPIAIQSLLLAMLCSVQGAEGLASHLLVLISLKLQALRRSKMLVREAKKPFIKSNSLSGYHLK